jgi:hypothetical protein
MNKKVTLLRFCYWLGAILDARAANLLTLLRFHRLPAGMAAQQLPHEFGLLALWGAGDATALMWGWTALLLWADRKPVERRGVLLLTWVPVILLLQVQMLQSWMADLVAFGQIAFWLFFLIGLGSLFGFSALYVSSKEESEERLLARSRSTNNAEAS